MLRTGMLILPVIFLATTSCLPREPNTTLVPANPFGTTPAASTELKSVQHVTTRGPVPPASIQAAARVDTLGRSILAANPQLGIQPLFRTIGAPQPEIFHHGTFEIDITEGLVNQCTTDAQLAAVLASELGKLVSERE